MDLKGLIHRELEEGLTETELATAARTSVILDSLHVSPTVSANLTKHLSHKGVSLLNVMHLSPLTTLTLCAVLSACAANTPLFIPPGEGDVELCPNEKLVDESRFFNVHGCGGIDKSFEPPPVI